MPQPRNPNDAGGSGVPNARIRKTVAAATRAAIRATRSQANGDTDRGRVMAAWCHPPAVPSKGADLRLRAIHHHRGGGAGTPSRSAWPPDRAGDVRDLRFSRDRDERTKEEHAMT